MTGITRSCQNEIIATDFSNLFYFSNFLGMRYMTGLFLSVLLISAPVVSV
jgi:hypothetical protein